MTQPISNERVEWLRQRAIVLDECIRLASAELHALTSGGAQRDDMLHALRGFNSERMAIAIEVRALQKYGVTP